MLTLPNSQDVHAKNLTRIRLLQRTLEASELLNQTVNKYTEDNQETFEQLEALANNKLELNKQTIEAWIAKSQGQIDSVLKSLSAKFHDRMKLMRIWRGGKNDYYFNTPNQGRIAFDLNDETKPFKNEYISFIPGNATEYKLAHIALNMDSLPPSAFSIAHHEDDYDHDNPNAVIKHPNFHMIGDSGNNAASYWGRNDIQSAIISRDNRYGHILELWEEITIVAFKFLPEEVV